MSSILVRAPSSMSRENLVRVNLAGTPGAGDGPDLVVVSGYALYDDDVVTGSADDDMLFLSYTLELQAGPLWVRVVECSPLVTVTGYESQEADEADMMGYFVRSCVWDLPEPPAERRIRLRVGLAIGGGENASIQTLGYQLTARGVLEPNQTFR